MTHAPAEFPDWLAHRAATTPSRIALIANDREWSFAELDADVTRAAQHLAAWGVREGDRVATLLHNGSWPVLLVHAVLRIGASLVPLNTRLGDAEIAWQLLEAAPRLVIVESRTLSLIGRVRHEQPTLSIASIDDAGARALDGALLSARHEASAALRSVHPADHVLALIHTSGTTGRPKAAMLTVANFWWSAIGSALNLGSLPDDRWLACLPLFHVGGLSIALRSAILGFTAVVHDGFDEAAVNRAIDDHGVTIVSVVTVMLQRMLDARSGRNFPPSLRCVLLGGGPAPRPLLERCAGIGAPVVQTYGLTETASQVATLAPGDAMRKLGSAGKPLYPNELRIEVREGDTTGDRAGEILVRGPVVMAGYADRPDETSRALAGGWLHTGDVGRLDDDGYLYVLDRRDDLIITGGENVYPAEVEAALLSHPLVKEAGVVGVPDSEWGKRVVAVVRLADGGRQEPSLSEELRAHCRGLLAAYKTPRDVIIVEEPLPRTASGKLQRAALRALPALAS